MFQLKTKSNFFNKKRKETIYISVNIRIDGERYYNRINAE